MADYYIYDTATSIITVAYKNRSTAPAAGTGETRVEVAYASPAMVGHTYHADGVFHKVEPVTVGLIARKVLQKAMRGWYGQFHAHKDSYPPAIATLGKNELHWGHEGAYINVNDASIPDDKRISFMYATAQGASDTEDIHDFIHTSEGLTASTGPISWVNQTDYTTRLALADRVSISGAVPNTVVLLDDAWTYSIPAYEAPA